MGTYKAGDSDVRTLIKAGETSYTVTLPVQDIRRFRWQEGQRLVIEADLKNKRFIIKDWKK